jgi:hypothetical protein
MRNASDKSCTEIQNTHFLFNNLFSEIRAVYEIMWKNVVERGRPQLIICRMRIACWIPKATNAHTDSVLLIAFPLQQWLHSSSSMLPYTCNVCLVYNDFYKEGKLSTACFKSFLQKDKLSTTTFFTPV